MQLISVNIGKAETIKNAKETGKTGIFKRPVFDPVRITALGLPGDAICDVDNHGGVDQAVYLYGTADYAWWSAEVGYDLEPGTFGENLTISDLESMAFNIGDRFQIGSTVLEVTAPRIPCVTLAARMDDPTFAKRFRHAGETISALEMYRFFYEPALDEATLRRHLAAPIAVRDRVDKEEKLQALLAQQTKT